MNLHPATVEQIVADHYEKLYRFGLSLAGNEAEAADLTQQTFYKLAAKGGSIRDTGKAKSWLFTTLYREFLSLRRTSNRFVSIDAANDPDDEDTSRLPMAAISVDSDAVRNADAGIVLGALSRVREIYRAPLALYYIDDVNYREIAVILDVPIGTVMSRLSRGKRELRIRLSENLRASDTADNIIPLRRKGTS